MVSRPQWLLLLFVAVPAFTQSVSSTKTGTSRTSQTDPAETHLMATERERSRAWGLSELEWRRYQSLLLGIRGSVSPANLSPLEVLGIHARDDAERRRYAELWARAMFEDAARILTFQRAYDAAVQRLYPNLLMIDNRDLDRDRPRKSALEREDRVLFFTRLSCPACDAVLAKLLTRLDDIDGVDVYVIDLPASDDTAIRQWAATHAIKPDWVRAGRVSLNHDNGILRRIGGSSAEIPALFVRRGDNVRSIEYAGL